MIPIAFYDPSNDTHEFIRCTSAAVGELSCTGTFEASDVRLTGTNTSVAELMANVSALARPG